MLLLKQNWTNDDEDDVESIALFAATSILFHDESAHFVDDFFFFFVIVERQNVSTQEDLHFEYPLASRTMNTKTKLVLLAVFDDYFLFLTSFDRVQSYWLKIVF